MALGLIDLVNMSGGNGMFGKQMQDYGSALMGGRMGQSFMPQNMPSAPTYTPPQPAAAPAPQLPGIFSRIFGQDEAMTQGMRPMNLQASGTGGLLGNMQPNPQAMNMGLAMAGVPVQMPKQSGSGLLEMVQGMRPSSGVSPDFGYGGLY